MKIKTKILMLMMVIIIAASGCAKQVDNKVEKFYVRVNDETLSKEYISYFFYVAELGMLSEAGYNSENSTDEAIATYWETTEIDGKNAVDVARDLAVGNAVMQKIQYQKAIEEGIKPSDEELDNITGEINATSESNGGYDEFENKLSEMGTDMEAYKQILTENLYISKLYEKYVSEGKLEVSEEALTEIREQYGEQGTEEEYLDFLRKEEFNKLVDRWKKEASVQIDDVLIKEIDIK